ncbi:type II secretion protein ATPase [Hahella sp. KA22]|uniref:type II secretion protein ATPase n=1 Tax=Hahella sp. KA22 TaxID=1628392 RepID=UPI000FDEE6BF|nr:type II secretion protein ATPase [Hahella sp. KA22]AZZ91377.1 type II secretion protein ATPase [Hahella sp. KA22]QAY54747.1 type II secretion protein ATPase [Hahella sp. KA22]
MATQQQAIERSRLGRLLVNRGYITEGQLNEALTAQTVNGQRLGELLVDFGWITDKELQRTLRRQSRYRYAAAFVAMAVAPFQPMVAFAASQSENESSPVASETLYQNASGLQALDDSEMSNVGAQGFTEEFQQFYNMAAKAQLEGQNSDNPDELTGLDGVQVLGSLGKLLLPITNVLDAEVEVVGVQIDPSRIKPLFNEDGGMNVTLPNHIEGVSFNNIRPMGVSADGPTMGSIHLEGIEFSDNSYIVVKPY